jgi:hypothetical protein
MKVESAFSRATTAQNLFGAAAGSPTMLFDSTTILLRSMVDSLQGGEETEWDGHLEYGNQCIYELFQMSRPDQRKYAGTAAPLFERASRAIPHVRQMNRAIRQKDRATAIECGRAAVGEMNGHILSGEKPDHGALPTAKTMPIAERRRKTAAKPVLGRKPKHRL